MNHVLRTLSGRVRRAPASPVSGSRVRRTLGIAFALTAVLAPVACVGGETDEPELGEVEQALGIQEGLFAIAGNGIWRRSTIGPGTGNDWHYAGEAYTVTAAAALNGSLYVTAGDNKLWKRGAIGPGTGNDWTYAGDAYNVVAMAALDGKLYAVSNNKLWRRGAIGPGTGNDWTYVGDAYNVVAMAALDGKLYVVSNNKLWRRGAIGPGTGNDWTAVGDAYNVTAMAAYKGALYVTATDKKIWKRGAIGPGTGNDWSEAGDAYGVVAMASIDAACAPGQKQLASGECVAPPPIATDKYYYLASRETGQVLRSSDLTFSNWAGTQAQRWTIWPTYDGLFQLTPNPASTWLTSDLFRGLITNEPIATLSAWSGKRNQKWAMVYADPPSSVLPADRRYIKVQTSEHQGKFLLPVRKKVDLGLIFNDVSLGTPSGKEYWRIFGAEPTREEAQGLITLREPQGEPWDPNKVPQLASLDAVVPEATEPVLIGDTPVPYYHVKNVGAPADQIKTSPYYRMSRYGFWKQIYSAYYPEPVSVQRTDPKEYKVGYTNLTSRSVEETIGIVVTASAGFTFQGLSAGLSVTFSRDLKVTSTVSTTVMREETETRNVVIPANARYREVGWAWTDRYELTDASGVKVLEWDAVNRNQKIIRRLEVPVPPTSP